MMPKMHLATFRMFFIIYIICISLLSPPSLTKKFTIVKNGCPKVSLSLVQQKLNLEKIVSPTPLYLTLINLKYIVIFIML